MGESKRLDDAITVVQRIMELEPTNAQPRLTLASLYWDSGKEDKAVGVLKEFVAGDHEKR